jgi:5S rRNA maturation endonuclease (ribonuclease M5)
MTRIYVFCEGKRDRRFLRRLIQERKGLTTSEIELGKLDDLLRKERFEGVALIE